jgi:hypothetical protein
MNVSIVVNGGRIDGTCGDDVQITCRCETLRSLAGLALGHAAPRTAPYRAPPMIACQNDGGVDMPCGADGGNVGTCRWCTVS